MKNEDKKFGFIFRNEKAETLTRIKLSEERKNVISMRDKICGKKN